MSEMHGVPIGEATARDFMMVRAALVRRLGGADQALVWSRIYYRCDEDSRVAEEHEGLHWWRASHAKLAEETGLSEKQARTAVESLVAAGFLARVAFSGRTFSYRPVTYLPISADALSAHTGTSIRPDGQVDLPSSALAPLIETRDIEDTPVVPRGDAIDEVFEVVWSAWPATRRGSSKKAASSFRTAVKAAGGVKNLDRLVLTVRAFCEAWASWPESDKRFVPMLSTWMNQERWTTPLPDRRNGAVTTIDHGRSVDEILRERRAAREGQEQLAVGA